MSVFINHPLNQLWTLTLTFNIFYINDEYLFFQFAYMMANTNKLDWKILRFFTYLFTRKRTSIIKGFIPSSLQYLIRKIFEKDDLDKQNN